MIKANSDRISLASCFSSCIKLVTVSQYVPVIIKGQMRRSANYLTLVDKFFRFMGLSIASRIGVGSFSPVKSPACGKECISAT